MTKFNPEGKEQLTYVESLGPAMEITDQADADQYFEEYARFIERNANVCYREAVDIARKNIGYFSGYYDNATARRVNHLFGATHHIFGDSEPSAEEAFKMGKELARKSISSKIIIS